MKKKVSVIMPAYNVEKYIEECIKSIINQTYSDFEIIVVNDGSTDNTEDIILKLQNENEDKIKYIKQQNQGAGQARNVGIENSDGDYVIFIDSDDKIKEDYIETLLYEIENTNQDIVCSGEKYFDVNGIGNDVTTGLYQYTLIGVTRKNL